MKVLNAHAKLVGCPLTVLPPLENAVVGLAGGAPQQLENASLASAMARVVFQRFPEIDAANAIALGLQASKLPGRGQICENEGVTYYLDGAHTLESVKCATQWFARALPSKGKDPIVLVFHCSHDRDGLALLKSILQAVKPDLFNLALFVPTTMGRPSAGVPPSLGYDKPSAVDPGGSGWHRSLALAWQHLAPPGHNQSQALLSPTDLVKAVPPHSHVFVVGSFYLVGDVLRDIVHWNPDGEGAF